MMENKKPNNIVSTVTTVEEYITTIKKYQSKRPLYRGENRKYHELLASAFRDTHYPFIKMKEEFKREVWSDLSLDVRNDFLAFCQHHGLPTNLLDFTYNPLIALYFACKGDMTDTGYVYLVNSEFMDITRTLNYVGDTNFLEKLSENDEEYLKLFIMLVNNFTNEHSEFFNYSFKNLKSEIQDLLRKENIIKEGENPDTFINDQVLSYNKGMDEILSVMLDFEYPDRAYHESLSYVLYLRYFIGILKKHNIGVHSVRGIIPMVYRPIMPFKRGLNQKGLFIYQAYVSYEDQNTKNYNLAIQKILCDSVIEIDNKEEIVKTLDLIGINDKFVYADYDSIARYIKQKYKWFLPKQ